MEQSKKRSGVVGVLTRETMMTMVQHAKWVNSNKMQKVK
jgi:hypothetical protein